MNTNYKNYYNKHATYYEKIFRDGDMFFHERIQRPQLLKYIGNNNFNHILDVGCGIGYYTKFLSAYGKEIVGIDISDGMIDIAKRNNNAKNVSYLCVDILKYKPNVKYDFIFAGFMPSYFDDLKIFFDIMFDLLSDNGMLITSMLHPIRMASVSKTDNAYVVREYLKSGIYESDFLSSHEPLKLKKHRYGKLFNTATESGLIIERIDEPVINMDANYRPILRELFYRYNPSIITYKIRKGFP